MIIYTKDDTVLVVPCGLGPNVCEDTSHDLQMKQVDSSTVVQHVEPDSSYYGLYRVIVNPYELDAKNVDPSTAQQIITSEKDGLSSVTVNAVNQSIDPDILPNNIRKGVEILGVTGDFEGGELQHKNVDSSTTMQNITPDENFYGLSHVTIAPYTLESKSQVITNNGDYTITAEHSDALSQVTLNVSVEGHVPVLQSKEVNSSTSSQSVTADQGYDGLSSVTVSPYTLDTKTVDPSINPVTVTSDADGLSSVTVNAITAAIDPDLVAGNIKKDVEILGVTGSFEGGTLQSKTVNSSTVSQTVSPDGTNYGLSSVTVNPYSVESKSDTITVNGQYSYSPSDSDALSGVTIDVQVADIPAVVQTKSVVYTANGDYTVTKDAGYDGMSSVDVSVLVTPALESAKTVNSSTVSQTVTYDDTQYDGLSSVTVNPYTLENKTVNSSTVQQSVTATSADGLAMVTVEPYTLDTKTVDPSTVSQTVTSSEDGLSSVTVNAVDSNIDPNILSNNIKNGVTILGITGSYVGQVINNQNKTVNSSTTSQSVTADNGYTGLGTVTVNPYTLDSKTIDPSTSSQTVNSSADGLSSVTVNAVTSSIDNNIQAGNIKSGVTILGIQGTYAGQVINNQNKTVNPSTNSQSITADSGYTGLGTVTVNPYTVESDSSTLTQNGTYTFTPATANALSQVTVNVSVNSGGGSDTVYLDAFEISRKTGVNAYIPTDYTPNASVNRIHGFVRGKTGSGEALRLIYTYGGYCDCYTHGINFVLEFGSGWNNKVSFTTSDANLSNGIAFDAVLSGSTWSVTVNGVTKTCTDATGSQTMYGLQLLGYDYTAMSYITFETDTDSWTFSPVAVANVSNNVINAYTGLYIKKVHTVGGVDTVTYVTQDNNGNALSSSYDFVTYEDNMSTGEIIDLSGQSFGSTYTFETGNYPSGVAIPAARLQNRTVSSSTNSQTVTKTSGYYYGLDTVTVNPYTLDSKTVNASTAQQVVNSSADGLSSVTVNAVTSSIDSNIQAGNIKNGVTILGVTGTYNPVSGDYIYETKTGVRTSLTTDFAGLTDQMYGAYSLFNYCNTLESLTATMATWGNTPGQKMYMMSRLCLGCENLESVSFPNWTGSGNASGQFASAFAQCTKLASVNFPEITHAYGFDGAFSSSGDYSADASANFGKLESIGDYGMTNCFSNSGFTSINMPLLETVYRKGLNSAFAGPDTSVSSMTFPSLTTCPNQNWTSLDLTVSSAFESAFANNPNITSVSFPELTTVGNQCFTETFYNATGLTTLSMPKLSTFDKGNFSTAFPFRYSYQDNTANFLYGCTSLVNLTIHPNCLAYGILAGAPNITNLTITDDITDDVRLDWQSSLTAASVLNVLSYLDLNTSGKTVTFYTGGLTVHDDAQGSIQTAYDAAVAAGWTISNLTITPYS